MIKLKHYLQKVCCINKGGDNNTEVENCVNELWTRLDDKPSPKQRLSRRKLDDRRPRVFYRPLSRSYERIGWSNEETSLRFLCTG